MFRDSLRRLMQEQGLTAKDLAEKIETQEDREKGVKLFRVIENWAGKRASTPGVDRALAIAQALGVTVEFMVTGEDYSISEEDRSLLIKALHFKEFLEAIYVMDGKDREKVLEIARLYAAKAKAESIVFEKNEEALDVAYGIPDDHPKPGERGYVRYKQREDDPAFSKPGDVRYKAREVKEGGEADENNSAI